MEKSSFPNCQVPSELFVESCGAVLFDLSNPHAKKVCLIHFLKKDEWLLAKGRRNCGEHRKDAALREVMEETGYQCHLHPVTMPTRAPPMDEAANVQDKARIYPNLTEPFMFTAREIDGVNMLPGEIAFGAEFFPCTEAVEKLTWPADIEVLQRAIELLESS